MNRRLDKNVQVILSRLLTNTIYHSTYEREKVAVKKNLIKSVVLLNSSEEAKALSILLSNLQINLEVIIMDNLNQFTSTISSEQIDCFIIDWKYQLYPATNIISKLRKSNKYRQTPIVLVVNPEDENIPLQYSTLNIDMIISRPFQTEKFKNKFINILDKKLGNLIPENFEVLILDDDPDILEIQIDNLKQLNHHKYQTCTSIAEAKKLVIEKDFDLLLLDWNLPDGTCIDLLQFILLRKEHRRLSEALIIVVTGRDDVDTIMTLLEYDVTDYILKPFTFSEFEEKLGYALERHHKKEKNP